MNAHSELPEKDHISFERFLKKTSGFFILMEYFTI
jgi:hypothetical protein